jgi:hypothetical protein
MGRKGKPKRYDQKHRKASKLFLVLLEVRIKNADGEYDRPIHKLCLIATKEDLNDKENKLE